MTREHAVPPVVFGRMLPIINRVLPIYDLTYETLVSRGRASRARQEARDLCCYIAKQLELPLSDTEIALAIRREKSAFKKGLKRVEKILARDQWLRETTDKLLVELRA